MNDEIPDGLAPMQYASKIAEDLGIPAKGNIPMIGEAIEAISKGRIFRGRQDSMRCAYIWLARRVSVAREQGQKINNLWFMNGLYNDVEKPVSELTKFVPCKKCTEGWIYMMKDGESTGRVKACECRVSWIESVKRKP